MTDLTSEERWRAEEEADLDITIAVQSVRLERHLTDVLDQPSGLETKMIVETVMDILAVRIPISMHKIDDSLPFHSEQGDCRACDKIRELFAR